MTSTIKIEKTILPRKKIEASQLGFGKYFSDHMYTLTYSEKSWKNPQITPYQNISMDPGASVFHYGQALFEGLKAYRTATGKIHLFRPDFHARRMQIGAKRLCMPIVPENIFLNAVETLVNTDQSWIPTEPNTALYIRPTLIGTESFLGVRASNDYLFFIITSPVGAYYSEGINPVKIWIEENFIRAAAGGLGSIKAAANYAASLQASALAKEKGYAQVLWLDAVKRKYIEEVGTMNVFFKIGDEVITPSLNDDSILAGATRDCVLQILKKWNIKVIERKISVDELVTAEASGQLKEVFGTGTAAVISPVGELSNEKYKITINNGKIGELTQKLHQEITDIQYGIKPDIYNWIKVIN